MLPPPGQQYTLSKWILGERCAGCCGPIGGDGPIGGEMYMRSGVSFPISGGALSQAIDTGWDIEGGFRSLFFNRDDDAAWTVDVSITNVFNPASKNAGQVTLTNFPMKTVDATGAATTVNVPALNVTPGNLNRTSVNLSGRPRNLAAGHSGQFAQRSELAHRLGRRRPLGHGEVGTERDCSTATRSFGGVFVGVAFGCRSAVWRCAVLHAGLRLEWGTDFSHDSPGRQQRQCDGHQPDGHAGHSLLNVAVCVSEECRLALLGAARRHILSTALTRRGVSLRPVPRSTSGPPGPLDRTLPVPRRGRTTPSIRRITLHTRHDRRASAARAAAMRSPSQRDDRNSGYSILSASRLTRLMYLHFLQFPGHEQAEPVGAIGDDGRFAAIEQFQARPIPRPRCTNGRAE